MPWVKYRMDCISHIHLFLEFTRLFNVIYIYVLWYEIYTLNSSSHGDILIRPKYFKNSITLLDMTPFNWNLTHRVTKTHLSIIVMFIIGYSWAGTIRLQLSLQKSLNYHVVKGSNAWHGKDKILYQWRHIYFGNVIAPIILDNIILH